MKVYYGCQKESVKPKLRPKTRPTRRKRPRKELIFVPYLDDLQPKLRLDLRLLVGGFFASI